MGQKWQYFLTSLATAGGNLFVLAVFVLILLSLTVYVLLHASGNTQVVNAITGAFTTFSGALLLALKGRHDDTNPPTPPIPPVKTP